MAELYRASNAKQRHQATVAVCRLALIKTRLHSADTDAAIQTLSNDASASAEMLQRLGLLGSKLDDEYLKLSEETEQVTPEAKLLFQQARAVSALIFALSPDANLLHEAIYEAIVAAEDRAETISVAEAGLTAEEEK